nr:tRNA lysidine(34) synthetase TilS [Chiayiivirga flava]
MPGTELVVGFSGGLDSSVLLHALAALPAARARGLRAVHVDHGLHPASADWASHCTRVAARLDVPLRVERVQVAHDAGLGLEAAARAARHAAFRAAMTPDAVLVLAHHRDDQVETVLLRLLHAAGHEGVAGMRAWRRFDPGWLWRPLLELPRERLVADAHAHGIDSIDDPSNADARFARNRLRHNVLPTLRAAWPDADARIAASATRLREDADALDALAAAQCDLLCGTAPDTLALGGLLELPSALRRRVLGLWLDRLRLPRPPPGVWRRVDEDLLAARADATPVLAWRGAQLRRYRGTLHALRERAAPAQDWCLPWNGAEPLQLPDGFGRLAFEPSHAFASPFHVCPRRGGERILRHGLQRPLRLCLQETGIPPWQRERLPLLFDAAGTLLAAGDCILSDVAHAWPRTHGITLRWTPDD